MGLREDIDRSFRRLIEDVDRVSDKEARVGFDDMDDQDLDNDGDTDKSDSYLYKRQSMVAKMDEAISESGLTFTPRSSYDATKFANALDNSDFHYEWDAREGRFFFPEEEDNYDELESNLQDIVDSINIRGRFEGVWLDEMSTTAGVPGYQTPYAFGDVDKDTWGQGGMKKVAKTSKIFKPMESKSAFKKMMAEMYGVKSVKESISYRDYKKDPTSTPQQKVNNGIAEVNRMLSEMEKIVHNNLRLKTEMGVQSNHFWKSTGSRFAKINERMTRIANKLKELSQ